MAFIKIKNFKGLVYTPEEPGARKHNCPDCYFCQMCSDERCGLCMKRGCSECNTEDDPDANQK